MRCLGFIFGVWMASVTCVGFGLDTVFTTALNLSDEAVQMAQMVKTLSDLKAITQTQSEAINYIKTIYKDRTDGDMFYDNGDSMIGKNTIKFAQELSDSSRTLSEYIGFDIINTPVDKLKGWLLSKLIASDEETITLSANAIDKLNDINKMRGTVSSLSTEGKENNDAKNQADQVAAAVVANEYHRNMAEDIKKLYSLAFNEAITKEAMLAASVATTNSTLFESLVSGKK